MTSTIGPGRALAFNYEEHRAVVCQSLRMLCDQRHALDPAVVPLLCTSHCAIAGDDHQRMARRFARRAPPPLVCVGLADLVALAGDHTRTPLQLAESSCVDLQRLSTSLRSYLSLAESNASHFWPQADAVYRYWHRMAQAKAFGVARMSAGEDSAAEAPEALEDALTDEAFALHFLTDQFSGGHRRIRREEVTDFVARKLHDQDSAQGLLTRDRYLLMGDGHLIRDLHSLQFAAIVHAVTASICDVLRAYVAGQVDAAMVPPGQPPPPHPSCTGPSKVAVPELHASVPPHSAFAERELFKLGVRVAVGGVQRPAAFEGDEAASRGAWTWGGQLTVPSPVAAAHFNFHLLYARRKIEGFALRQLLAPGVSLLTVAMGRGGVALDVRYPLCLSHCAGWVHRPEIDVRSTFVYYRVEFGLGMSLAWAGLEGWPESTVAGGLFTHADFAF